MLYDKLMKLIGIAVILQGSLDLFTAKFATLVGIETVYQLGKEGGRRIGVQIAIGARAIDLFKANLQPVMLAQKLDLLFLDIFS